MYTLKKKLKSLYSSSDTESTDVRPKDEKNILSPIKLTSFFKKNKDKVASEEETEAKTMDNNDVKIPLETENPQQQQSAKEGLVYAELDLVSPNLRPVVKNDDEKTEYAEIVYTKETDDGGKKQGV